MRLIYPRSQVDIGASKSVRPQSLAVWAQQKLVELHRKQNFAEKFLATGEIFKGNFFNVEKNFTKKELSAGVQNDNKDINNDINDRVSSLIRLNENMLIYNNNEESRLNTVLP